MHQVDQKQNDDQMQRLKTPHSPGDKGETYSSLDVAAAEAVGAEFDFRSIEAPSWTTRSDFRRCEDDSRFFEELIEG